MATVSSPQQSPSPTEAAQTNGVADLIRSWLPQIPSVLQKQGALIALVVVVVFSTARYSNFDLSTIYNVLNFNLPFGLIALGMTFVIMTGGIDLSVGGIAALGSCVAALNSGHGFFVAAFVAVLVGAAVGVINGFVIAYLNILQFITTLATLYAVRGFSLKLINDASSVNLAQHTNFEDIGTMHIDGGIFSPALPITIPILFGVFLIGMFVLRYTQFGRYVLAIGGNAEASRLMGLPIKRTLMIAYSLNGALAGLAGVFLAVNLSGGSATEGNGWELVAIACVVVGGTLLTGGVGSMFGTLIGVLLLGVIVQILQLENYFAIIHPGSGLTLSSFWQDVIRGGFLLVVVLLQSQLERRRAKKLA